VAPVGLEPDQRRALLTNKLTDTAYPQSSAIDFVTPSQRHAHTDKAKLQAHVAGYQKPSKTN
jgi:hypothetical protein